MNIEVNYPNVGKPALFMAYFRKTLRYLLILAAITCPIVNLAVGGKLWCLVSVWVILGIWDILAKPDVIEYSLIRQTVKLTIYVCVLLVLIDQLLAPGWASFVVPIVGCASLIVTFVIFVSDLHTQMHNMMPMIWQILLALGFSGVTLAGWPEKSWPMIALGSLALLIVIIGVLTLHKEIWMELKKRFHVQ